MAEDAAVAKARKKTPKGSSKQWFDVDKRGLGAQAHGCKEHLVYELYANGIDQKVTRVAMTLGRPEHGWSELTVEDDDPDGFKDIADAYTLFAPSKKGDDPEKHGIFNFGEKRVLAACKSASIRTTTGAITFEADGRHSRPSLRTERGSVFSGLVPMTVAEWEEACAAARRILPPKDVEVTFNGERLGWREPLAVFEETLQTVVLAKDGDRDVMKPVQRKGEVRVVETKQGEKATLYSFGIPVVELPGDRWHIDVRQRMPVGLSRDNVPPAYLRTLRVAVLNAMHEELEDDDANATWVRDAASDPRCSDDAITKVLHDRFGDKFVAYDPSDVEANKLAVAAGYQPVGGKTLSTGEWANAKRAKAILPAGQVTPSSPQEFKLTDPLPDSKLTDGMRWTAAWVDRIARKLVRENGGKLFPGGVSVIYISAPNASNIASYGGLRVTFNVGRLGKKYFADGATAKLMALTAHELGHELCSDHLDKRFPDAVGWIAAQMARLALDEPGLFAVGG